MTVKQTLLAAEGWIEIGLAEEALVELADLPKKSRWQRNVLELTLEAQMACQSWNAASETGRLLCLRDSAEPTFFIKAAFCLHETGDTLAACNLLLRGPKSLLEMAIFHYNLACYLWTLGEESRARTHLSQAIQMDESYRDTAREDRDLAGIGVLE